MKRRVVVLILIAGAVAFGHGTSAQADTTVTTHWQVFAWIGNATTSGVFAMTATGGHVVGQFKDNKITGQLVNHGNQLNGTWTGPRGTGWITLHFHNGGQGFSGTWGPKGKPADGKLAGQLLIASPTPGAP